MTSPRVSVPHVAALFLHPLKSAAAIGVRTLELDLQGARGDRRWMLVDLDGVALTQRVVHRLAHVRPSFVTGDRNGDLQVDAPDHPAFVLSVDPRAPTRVVRIWADTADVIDAGDDAARWMSSATGTACRVVRVAERSRRPLAGKHAGPIGREGREVALSDGAPLLLLGASSIRALNDRLAERGEPPLGVDRFRPNILVEGTPPHAEDEWELVQVGDVQVGLGSACVRCAMTTIDKITLEQGIEPLRTLATYRRGGGGVVFGMNSTNATAGVVRLGDEVRVLGDR